MELERVETGTGWICKSLQGSRGKTGGKHTNRDQAGNQEISKHNEHKLNGKVRGGEVIRLARKLRDKTEKLAAKC